VRLYRKDQDPAGQVWFSLQAYRLQQEILKKEFVRHAIVNEVIHEHIRDQVVSKCEFDSTIKKLQSELEAVKKLCQKAASQQKKQR